MNDDDIIKLATKLTESLATKDDLKKLATKDDLNELKADVKKIKKTVEELNAKTDTILKYADGIDDTTTDHERRLKKIEAASSIAHQIQK